MIDDNPMEHLIMQKMFERYELFPNAMYSYDGQAIIDLINKNRQSPAELPDLILLDLNMPGCSGFDFLEQLDKLYLSLSKPICIYIVSSSVDENDRQCAFSYRFVKDFLTKPVKKEKLIALHTYYCQLTRQAG
jgi:CheY-like chemotaxis protein